jgi:hypothetical protein
MWWWISLTTNKQLVLTMSAYGEKVLNDRPLSGRPCSWKALKCCNTAVPQYLFALSLSVFLYNIAVFSFYDVPFVSDDKIRMLCTRWHGWRDHCVVLRSAFLLADCLAWAALVNGFIIIHFQLLFIDIIWFFLALYTGILLALIVLHVHHW